MKKRISAVLLALCMTLALFPAHVLAADSDFTISQTGVLTKYTGASTDVVIPEGVIEIGNGVFQGLPLTSVTFPGSLLKIGPNAFEGCRTLTSITLPENLVSIGSSAFNNCVGIKSIVISGGVKIIDSWAFQNCLSLKSITIPASVTKIGYSAFYDDISLEDVYYGGSEMQWNMIDFGSYNHPLLNAAVHYNSTSQETPDPEPTPTPVEVHFPRANVYNQGQFTDVPANQWYTDGVKQAFEMGLMVGDSATTFAPQSNVTVAQAIAMAARVHSIYTTGSEDFQPDGVWYQVYLDYAFQNGIISKAYYDSDVTRNATRAQFAEIFANALPDEALSPINTVSKIPDVPSSAYYASHVYKLYRAGILSGGDANGTFSPDSYITRQEAAAIVSRMAESSSRVKFTL